MQNALGDLEKAGVLREVTGQRRNRTWVARGIMRVLMGLPPEVLPDTEQGEMSLPPTPSLPLCPLAQGP